MKWVSVPALVAPHVEGKDTCLPNVPLGKTVKRSANVAGDVTAAAAEEQPHGQSRHPLLN